MPKSFSITQSDNVNIFISAKSEIVTWYINHKVQSLVNTISISEQINV